MPQVSSLHLGSVSTHSRGLFPLPSLSSSESSPKRLLGPVLIYHGSSSCWINHHPDAWRAACLTDKSVTVIFLLSNSHCLILSIFMSCSFFFSFKHTYTSIHTPGQTMHPFFAMPSSILGLPVRKLSRTSKTAYQHQHLENIQIHTTELVGQLEDRLTFSTWQDR